MPSSIPMLALDRATVRVDSHDAALSFDFKSVRTTDRDGRLHVDLSHISKANICPYLGKEIPGWESLGLEPTKIYQLYRDPEEMAKAASTFNNLPLLSEHVPVDAQDHRPDLVIGSTGTDAVFNSPYLDNSLVIWAEKSIQGVDSQKKRQLSSAYYYTPDMTPGEANGERFDGVMRDIIGNHVAVVPEGRAGADVTVADSKQGYEPMTRPAKNTRFAAIRAALLASFVPKLAADATIEDLNDLLNNISAVPKDLDEPNDAGKTDSTDNDQIVKDADPINACKEFLKGKLSAEDMAEFDKMLAAIGAPDEAEPADPSAGTPAGDGPGDTEEKDDGKVTAAAMDAAIAIAVKATEKRVAQTQAGIATALRTVRPYVGDLAMSFDSGEAVLRHSLGMLGVAGAKTIHATALDALLSAQPKPGRARTADPIAQDAAGAAGYAERFPGADRLMVN